MSGNNQDKKKKSKLASSSENETSESDSDSKKQKSSPEKPAQTQPPVVVEVPKPPATSTVDNVKTHGLQAPPSADHAPGRISAALQVHFFSYQIVYSQLRNKQVSNLTD